MRVDDRWNQDPYSCHECNALPEDGHRTECSYYEECGACDGEGCGPSTAVCSLCAGHGQMGVEV